MYGFKFQGSACNGCHDLTMLFLKISNSAIITAKGIIIGLFMALTNLKQFICQNILYLKIVNINIIHVKEISIKNRVYNYWCQAYGLA